MRSSSTATSNRWRPTPRSADLSARTGLAELRRTTPGPTVIRKRPDSGSMPSRSLPCAHGAAGSKRAAAEATISGLGNRCRSASAADQSASMPDSAAPRTLLGHITSPGVPARTRPTPLPPPGRLSHPAALRPRALASSRRPQLRPCSGWPFGWWLTKRWPASPSLLSCRPVDPVMLGIRYSLPGSPRRASRCDGRSGNPWSGVQAPVRFMSVRRTA